MNKKHEHQLVQDRLSKILKAKVFVDKIRKNNENGTPHLETMTCKKNEINKFHDIIKREIEINNQNLQIDKKIEKIDEQISIIQFRENIAENQRAKKNDRPYLERSLKHADKSSFIRLHREEKHDQEKNKKNQNFSIQTRKINFSTGPIGQKMEGFPVIFKINANRDVNINFSAHDHVKLPFIAKKYRHERRTSLAMAVI